MALSDVSSIATNFKPGSVGVLPTDTVYGLVARAGDRRAVERLYSLKHRERKPGTVIAASVEQLIGLGLNADLLHRVERYWPNAMSVIIAAGDGLEYLHQGLESIAVRVPGDRQLQELLQLTGPLLTSSANQPGEPPANTVAAAKKYFGDSVDFYIDGGDLSGRQPSTIVRIDNGKLSLIRAGAVAVDELSEQTADEVLQK